MGIQTPGSRLGSLWTASYYQHHTASTLAHLLALLDLESAVLSVIKASSSESRASGIVLWTTSSSIVQLHLVTISNFSGRCRVLVQLDASIE
jgi:hypothetical protein